MSDKDALVDAEVAFTLHGVDGRKGPLLPPMLPPYPRRHANAGQLPPTAGRGTILPR